MKTSCYLFAILAVGSLSTVAAAAEPPGPDAKAGVTAAAPAEPGSGPAAGASPVTGGTDHGNDAAGKNGPGPGTSGPGEGTSDNGALRSKMPGKAGGAAGSEKGGTMDIMHQPIDTSIIVNQGRRTPFRGSKLSKTVTEVSKRVTDFRDRLLRKSKVAIAPPTLPFHHGPHKLQLNSRFDAKNVAVRNAAGAVVAPPAVMASNGGATSAAPRQSSASPPGPIAQGPVPQQGPGAAAPVSAANTARPPNGTAPTNNAGPPQPTVRPAVALATAPATTAAPALAAVTAHGAAINGSGMIRPRGTGSSGTVGGGTPKVVVGVLSGNSFKPRHP